MTENLNFVLMLFAGSNDKWTTVDAQPQHSSTEYSFGKINDLQYMILKFQKIGRNNARMYTAATQVQVT